MYKVFFLELLLVFIQEKLFIGLDNMFTYGARDLENTSVRCSKCNLINSFSFQTNQTTCIRCNSNLDSDEILAAERYKDSLRNKEFFKKPQDFNGENNV